MTVKSQAGKVKHLSSSAHRRRALNEQVGEDDKFQCDECGKVFTRYTLRELLESRYIHFVFQFTLNYFVKFHTDNTGK